MAAVGEREQQREETPQEWLDRKIQQLAASMRQYDILAGQAQSNKVRLDQIEEDLVDIDLDADPRSMPTEVAYRGLESVIVHRKAEQIKDQIRKVGFSPLEKYEARSALLGVKLRITAIGDRRMGTLKDSGAGSLMGMSQYFDMREGRFREMYFDLATGGAIEINSANRFSGRIFQAHPLIDRSRGYQPAFQIEVID